jgi:hypothetical protein
MAPLWSCVRNNFEGSFVEKNEACVKNKTDVMIRILVNDFCEILFDKVGRTLIQKWQKISRKMSETEFTEQIDTLFSSIEIYEPEVILIDAHNFNYRIGSKYRSYISQFLDVCKIRSIVLIPSQGFTGLRSLAILKELAGKITQLKVIK